MTSSAHELFSAEAQSDGTVDVEIIDLRTVRIERIEWLDTGRIPFGELTITEGQGGIGKTTAILDIIARASSGARLPGGQPCEAYHSLVIATEDSHSTLKARLIAAGANLERVHLGTCMSDGEMLTLPTHAPAIERVIRRLGARIVYIDSLFSHLDAGLNPDRASDVRRALGPLSVMAHSTKAAVLAMRHWRKSGGDAAARGLGSVDIRNIARSVLTIGAHPQREGVLVCAVSKSNLGKPADALLYRLESVDVPTDDGGTVSVGRVVWEGTEAIAADDLAATADATEESLSRRDAAADFLEDVLADGPMPSQLVYDKAKDRGIAASTLKRAAKRLRIVQTRSGFPARSQWDLPQSVHGESTASIYGLTEPTEPTGDSSQAINIKSAQLAQYNSFPRARELTGRCTVQGKFCSNCKRIGSCVEQDGRFICTDCFTEGI